jgi:RHS repeat-associated protein
MIYDDRGRVTKVTAPLGRIASASYDNLNRVISSTDPLGRTVQYQYDVLNRVKKAIYPDATFVTMTYDNNGNRKTLSDEKGNITSYDYDQMNRLVKRTNPLGQYSTYQYDYNNNLKQIIDRQGRTTTFDYNSRDELIRTTLFDGTIINRTYDAVGRLVSLDDSRDGRIDWEYDILDRVVKETTSQGTVAYAYDTEGRRTTLSTSNGYSVSYGYDAADRVTSVTKGSQTFAMSYDAADRMTSLTMPNGIAASYSFDVAGRNNRILYQKGAQTLKDFQYILDVADQITQISGTPAHTFGDNLVSTSAVNQNNQYTAFGSDTLQQDASGNLKIKGQNNYQWDVRDRLVGITGPGLIASFSYDALGRRINKNINGVATVYTYDGAGIIQDNNAQYLQGVSIDDVLSRTSSGSDEYYLKDHLGSTVALADQNGNLTTQYGYSPYGQVSKNGASNNYFTYTGREDDSTGLYYYRSRYYSPDLKRFISEDRIGFAGGNTNLNAYVQGSPINHRDPSGNCIDGCVLEGAGAAALLQWLAGGAVVVGAGGTYLAAQKTPPLQETDPGKYEKMREKTKVDETTTGDEDCTCDDPEQLASKVQELGNTEFDRKNNTTAVLQALDPLTGIIKTLVANNRGRLGKFQREYLSKLADVITAKGMRKVHAEDKVLDLADLLGLIPLKLGVSPRDICTHCQKACKERGLEAKGRGAKK